MTYEHWQTIFSIGVAVWIVFAYLMIMELRSTVKKQSHQIKCHGDRIEYLIKHRDLSIQWMDIASKNIDDLQEKMKP